MKKTMRVIILEIMVETTQGIGIFPSVPEGTKIINPKYGEPSKEDYDASTVEKGKTRIIFELDGAKWDYPVVFEVENGRLFLTSARQIMVEL